MYRINKIERKFLERSTTVTKFNHSTITNYRAVDDDNNNIDYCYNPDAETFSFWIDGVILNTIGLMGIFGNILSMIILSRPQMRSNITYLLLGLVRCDTIVLLTSILLYGLPEIYPNTGYLFDYHYYIYPHLLPYVFPLAAIAQTASIHLTLIISLERYVAVCHPLRVRSLCTYGRTKMCFLFCITFSIVFNLVRFWEIHTISCEHKNYTGLIVFTGEVNLNDNVYYQEIYINWCCLIVNYLIPFIGLLITSILIYRQIRNANMKRPQIKSNCDNNNNGLANMLFGIVIVFFCCNILELCMNTIEPFSEDGDDDDIDEKDLNYTIISMIYDLSYLLVTINSSVNFIIYVVLVKKFRDALYSLLMCNIGRM